MIIGLILLLPIGLFFGAIIIISPFQFIRILWEDGASRGGVNHACDWWINPLSKATDGRGLMILGGLVVYFVVCMAFLGYHGWVCERFGIDSPLEKR